MRVLPVGDTGLLVELADLGEVLRLSAALRDQTPAGVLEVVPAARTILLRCDPDAAALTAVAAAVRRTPPAETSTEQQGNLVEIPTVYDGEDLGDVTEATGRSRSDLVDWHTTSRWTVAFCGFAPGFGYLVTDDPLPVPRRQTPRTKVPPGAVGLAGEFSGVYPRESPGGWQLIGRTALTTFDLDADPPALLRPGVRVRFVQADADGSGTGGTGGTAR